MHSRQLAVFVAAALVVAASSLHADTGPQVVGEKVDSGLGQLPHYSQWADPTGKAVVPVSVQVPRRTKLIMRTGLLGEKIDSGLGQLPHYSQWADATGKDPMGPQVMRTARTER